MTSLLPPSSLSLLSLQPSVSQDWSVPDTTCGVWLSLSQSSRPSGLSPSRVMESWTRKTMLSSSKVRMFSPFISILINQLLTFYQSVSLVLRISSIVVRSQSKIRLISIINVIIIIHLSLSLQNLVVEKKIR